MKSFKDNQDRTWEVAVNVSAVKRVLDLCQVDLRLPNPEVLERLGGDVILLVNVLYVLCKSQADRQGVSDEQFGEALAGDALEQATNAFAEAWADFFPQSRRSVLNAALAKGRDVDRRVAELAVTEIAGQDVELLAKQLISGKEPGPSPASSASTPEASPSAS